MAGARHHPTVWPRLTTTSPAHACDPGGTDAAPAEAHAIEVRLYASERPPARLDPQLARQLDRAVDPDLDARDVEGVEVDPFPRRLRAQPLGGEARADVVLPQIEPPAAAPDPRERRPRDENVQAPSELRREHPAVALEVLDRAHAETNRRHVLRLAQHADDFAPSPRAVLLHRRDAHEHAVHHDRVVEPATGGLAASSMPPRPLVRGARRREKDHRPVPDVELGMPDTPLPVDHASLAPLPEAERPLEPLDRRR